MADFNAVATQFTEYYYSTFDAQKEKSGLAPLYRDASMLTFETNQVMGVAAIVEKLNSLPFSSVVHKVATLDAQPAGPDGSIMVLVTGELVIDGEHPQKYSQAFHLIPEGGSYYVLNDIFRLVYG